MDNRFFFISTYDNFTGRAIAEILGEIPGIKCQWTPCTPFIHQNYFYQSSFSTKIVDSYIQFHHSSKGDTRGNVGRFNAFELQHRILTEKTVHPLKAIKIALSPKIRVSLLLQEWLEHFNSATFALDKMEQEFKKLLKQNHSIFELYIFHHFLNKVYSIAQTNNIDSNQPDNRLFLVALAFVLALDSADLPTTSKTYCFEELINNEDTFRNFLSYLAENRVISSTSAHLHTKEKLNRISKVIGELEELTWEPWQNALLSAIINLRFETIYYPHINKPLSWFYKQLGYKLPAIYQTKEHKTISKLLSIQLNSNRPAQLAMYFDNIEDTADNPSDIEIIVNIDIGDSAIEKMLQKEMQKRKFTLKYISTERPASFCDLWKPINSILAQTDPGAYFLLNISDEMLFATKGWDTILRKYVGFFPDDIFRLRASRNKFRNYFDRWECSFAQDSIPITTKKWIDIGGDWNPCFGPDSFQQLVSFYLSKEGKFSNKNYLREIPVIDIQFYGDVPSLGMDRKKLWKHMSDHVDAMLICQSYKMQMEARRRALLLKLHILASDAQVSTFKIEDDKRHKKLSLLNTSTGQILYVSRYNINPLTIFATNQIRKFRFFSYFGDGDQKQQHILLSFTKYLKARHAFFQFAYEILSKFRILLRFTIRLARTNPLLLVAKSLKKSPISLIRMVTKKNAISLKDENLRLQGLCEKLSLENESLKCILLEPSNETSINNGDA